MTPSTKSSAILARRLWARSAGNASASADVVEIATTFWRNIDSGLERWIGASGYQTLLARAIVTAREDYPWLGSMAAADLNQQMLRAAETKLGSAEVTGAMVFLLAELIELLGRLIGEEMALKLVEQVSTPSSHGIANTRTEDERDG